VTQPQRQTTRHPWDGRRAPSSARPPGDLEPGLQAAAERIEVQPGRQGLWRNPYRRIWNGISRLPNVVPRQSRPVIDGDFSQEFRQHDARRLSRGVVVCGFTDAAFLSVVGPSDAARDCKAHPGGEAVPGWDCRDRLTIDNRPAHRTAASGPWGISSKSLLDRRFRQRRREQWPNCAEFLFSRIPSRAKYRCPKSISHYLSTFD
jgi:hypothetical protein